MSKVLVTGAAGFIGGYLVEELLARDHEVVGLDNLSKYGPVEHAPRRRPALPASSRATPRDVELVTKLLDGCDHFIAGAAMIGGISYFHTYAYDLLATNERIIAAACDAAIAAHRDGRLQKVTYLSSSMVFESTDRWPSAEGDERQVPPPLSSYGFQKLAVEYFARAAWDQYELPYTILRPFNCVGIGERRAKGGTSILLGQRRAGHEPRGPRPGAEGAEGPGPAAPPGRRRPRFATTPTAATWPAASRRPWSTRPPATTTSTSPPTPSTTVLELAEAIWQQDQGRRMSRCATCATTRSTTTCSGGCRPPRRRGASSASRPRPAWTRCSTRSSPGSSKPSPPARSEPTPSMDHRR